LPPAIALLPLRLSLVDPTFPMGAAFGEDPCFDPTGTAVPLFASNRSAFLPLAPRLVLHGFSSGRCVVDSGVGGGITYAAPIAKDWWLTAGLGTYAVQALRANQPTSLIPRADARVDVVFRPAPDRAWAFGVGRRGLTLTGIW
jgi:hypothetical protein